MSGTAFVDQLKAKFGDKITGANLENIDPWIEVTPDGLVEVCRYLRDEPSLAFDYFNCISGVDYLEPDEKKAAKVEWQPHMEVVYHLFSMKHKHSLVLKVMLPRWKDDEPGELPEVPTRRRRLEHGRLARARVLRPVRRVLHRPSQPAAHPLPRRLGRPSAAQRLRNAARIPRNSRAGKHASISWPPCTSTIPASSNSTSARTRCSSTWARSTPARTACCGSCCGPTARSSRKSRRTSAICTAARKRSARISRRGSGFPTPTAWTTWPG